MTPLHALVRRRRLLDTERRFFDAYGRGGEQRGRPLVVPSDFFVREATASVLRAWAATGGALDVAALEQAWRQRRDASEADAAHLRENLTHFACLLGDTHACAGMPPAPAPLGGAV